MGSSQSILEQLAKQMNHVAPFVLLIVGMFGCFGNFITFTARQLKKNSCAFYFLSTSIFDFFILSFGLITRIAEQYGSTLKTDSRIYCKIQAYLLLTFSNISTYLLLMGGIDRCMSTSTTARYRKFSQYAVARRIVCTVIIISMVLCSHTLIFVDEQPACLPQPGLYALFYSVFLIAVSNLLPNSLLILFVIRTIQHVRKTRRHIVQITVITQRERRLQKTNAQFVVMAITQALVANVMDITRGCCYSYYLLSNNYSKSTYQQTVDTFILQFSLFIFYLGSAISFFTYTLTSKLFRKVFRQTSQQYYRHFIRILMVWNRQHQNVVHMDQLNRNTQHLQLRPVTHTNPAETKV